MYAQPVGFFEPVTKGSRLDFGSVPPQGPASPLRAIFREHALDVHVVDHRRPGSYDILESAYKGLFEKFFPHEVHQEPLDKWHRRLEAADAPSKYMIGITGQNLNDPASRTLAGMFIGIYYKHAETGLLAYNIVDDTWQGSGLGSAQVRLRKQMMINAAAEFGTRLRGLFSECNDPAIVPASDDIMQPTKRVEMYAHMGARRVPIRYTCPSGAPECDKLSDMMLLAYPHPLTGRYPEADDVESYLRGTYEVRGLKPDGDPDFARMKREMKKRTTMKPNSVTDSWLVPLVNANGKCVVRPFTP